MLVTLLGAREAQATTLVRMSLEQLSQASTDIVRGRVINQESRWNSDHTRILTLTTFAIEDCMKGHASGTLVVEQPGGKIGETHVTVAGTAVFFPDTSYMLFLEPAGAESSHYLVVGMGAQGARRIYRDATTHEERVSLPSGTFTAGAPSPAIAPNVQPSLLLGDFRQVLSSAMSAPIVIPRGTSIPVAVRSVESQGAGHVHVSGQTTVDIYPSASIVIPAGSPVEGTAKRRPGEWKIRWTEVSVRGARVPINATSDEPASEPLRGKALVVEVK